MPLDIGKIYIRTYFNQKKFKDILFLQKKKKRKIKNSVQCFTADLEAVCTLSSKNGTSKFFPWELLSALKLPQLWTVSASI